MSSDKVLDVLVVGGGFSGILAVYLFRKAGFSLRAVEKAPGLGGTWRLNTYPGARVDSNKNIYALDIPELYENKKAGEDFFYTEKYPDWREIQQYFAYADKKLQLSKEYDYNTKVVAAHWDEAAKVWRVRAESPQGPRSYTCRNLMMNLGFASKSLKPKIPGLQEGTFKGRVIHTNEWPEGGVDLTGKRVAVIGTGASGIQTIQEVGPVAKELVVFQRTPNLTLPMRQEKSTVEQQLAEAPHAATILRDRFKTFGGFTGEGYDFYPKDTFSVDEAERQAFYERMWNIGGFAFWLGGFQDYLFDAKANDEAYKFWHKKQSARVKDPRKRDLLCPPLERQPHYFGCKRPSLEQRFYEVMNLDHIDIVDIKKENPIECITEKGIRTGGTGERAKEWEFDVIVLATGFDTHTGALSDLDIRGRDGAELSKLWRSPQGAEAYLGVSVSGLPNFWYTYSLAGTTAFSNGPSCCEIQTRFVVDTLRWMRENGKAVADPKPDAQHAFRKRIDADADKTLFSKVTTSWYFGGNVEGKVRHSLNWISGTPAYIQVLEDEKKSNYANFAMA